MLKKDLVHPNEIFIILQNQIFLMNTRITHITGYNVFKTFKTKKKGFFADIITTLKSNFVFSCFVVD